MHETFELIYKGMLLGLITAFSFGPIFFTIIETSISRGISWAISIAVGVLMSDAFMIAIATLSVSTITENSHIKNLIGFVGGTLLVLFGFYHLIKQPAVKSILIPQSRTGLVLYFFKGFIINTANPFVLIYWVSAVSIVSINQDYNDTDRLIFFAAALGFNFSIDLLKTFLASRFKHLMTHKTLLTLNRLVGVALMIFGIRLILKAYGI